MPKVDLFNSATKPIRESSRMLPQSVLEAIEFAPLPSLGHQASCKETSLRMQRLLDDLPQLRDTVSAAALWLLAGELDRSHAISQAIETANGSYWHGIMHRREGDFWNAKYWFRRVGRHPVFEHLAGHISTLAEEIRSCGLPLGELTQVATMPASLVDCCEQTTIGRQVNAVQSSVPTPDVELVEQNRHRKSVCLQHIFWLEWQLLFLHGWKES